MESRISSSGGCKVANCMGERHNLKAHLSDHLATSSATLILSAMTGGLSPLLRILLSIRIALVWLNCFSKVTQR